MSLVTRVSALATRVSTEFKTLRAESDAKYVKLLGGTAFRISREAAQYSENATNLTGSLVIQTNLTFGNYMSRFHITGYNYAAEAQNIDLVVTFYAYSANSTFVNTGVANNGNVLIKVDLAKRTSDGKVAIILTPMNTTATWSYPKLLVDAIMGSGVPSAAELAGWTITRQTSLAAWTVLTTPAVTAITVQDLIFPTSASQTAMTWAFPYTSSGYPYVMVTDTAGNAVDVGFVVTQDANNRYRVTFKTDVVPPQLLASVTASDLRSG